MSGPTKLQIKFARKFGKRYGVKPDDLLDVIEHESNFDPLATEHFGTVSNHPSESQGGGLTQFIPSTAAAYGVKYGASKKAQKTQIKGAAHYLKDLGYGSGSPAEVRDALAGYYGAASPYADDVINSTQYAKFNKGNVSIPGMGSGQSKGSSSKAKRIQTQAAVDNSADRTQLALSFIQDEDHSFEDILGYVQEKKALADVPAKYKNVQVKGQKASNSGEAGGGPQRGPSIGKKGIDIVSLGKWAEKKFGLSVGENPHFGGVAPVHATNSYHYSGRAIDVSGDPEAMRKFAQAVAKKYGSKLAELFWQGAGGIDIDNGQVVPQGFVSGHTDHVHVAI